MKRWMLVVAVLVVAAAGWGFFQGRDEDVARSYRMATLEQGDLESVVSATGTLSAVTTVQVGTQVSGIVDAIYVDFNDPVEEGQVIARIDTTLLANAVASAEATLDRGRAELLYAERENERIQALHAKGMVSDEEANAAEYSHEIAKASVRSAELALARAEQNLAYATITAPIDGTVIARTVDEGQTVQASLSAPELFQIAGDLTRMQILASVDESDIGQIAEGQTARFTVQAYADDTFEGVVRQVRLQSTTEENVVNYTVVVDVDNPDGRLLPGMTATVDFVVQTATDVTYVSNAALRYQPDSDTMQAALERLREQGRPQRSEDAGDEAERGQRVRPDRGSGERGILWALGTDGELVAVPVRTGISDGTQTVVMGPRLDGVTEVIAGVTSASAASQSNSSPFQQQNGNQRRQGPPSPGGF